MKNKRKMMSMIVLVIAIVLVVFTYLNVNNLYEEKIIIKPNKVNKGIAINLEQTEGAGDYKLVTQSNWPTDGYIFNKERSGCENGGELSWDDTKKIVVMTGNEIDKCYVYFDIKTEKTLVKYVLSQYTGIQGKNSIYYHNNSLANGAGDNSYRYAGSSEEVNNFVCFGSTESPCPEDYLYRIIGVIDDKVKLIKYDYMTTDELGTGGYNAEGTSVPTYDYKGTKEMSEIGVYFWNKDAATNTWSTSQFNKTNLNTNFINYLGEKWSKKIATTTWKVGGNTVDNIIAVIPSVVYQNEITNPDATNSTDNATE